MPVSTVAHFALSSIRSLLCVPLSVCVQLDVFAHPLQPVHVVLLVAAVVAVVELLADVVVVVVELAVNRHRLLLCYQRLHLVLRHLILRGPLRQTAATDPTHDADHCGRVDGEGTRRGVGCDVKWTAPRAMTGNRGGVDSRPSVAADSALLRHQEVLPPDSEPHFSPLLSTPVLSSAAV